MILKPNIYAPMALLVLYCLSFATQSQDLKTQAPEQSLLAVGSTFNRIFEQAVDGEYTGLSVDILKAFAEQQHLTIHFQITPWRRAQSMVERGQADILIGPYNTQARRAHLAFSAEPFYRDDMVFYARKGSRITWNGDYASIKGLRIGKMSGWSYGATFTEQASLLTIYEFTDIKSGIERLSRGDLDLLATNVRNTDAVLAKINIANVIEPILPIIDIQDGFMAFPKHAKFDPLRHQFNRFFEDIIQNGTLTSLSKKHGVTQPYSSPFLSTAY